MAGSPRQRPRFVAFAVFCVVNISARADFKLPSRCCWRWCWEEVHSVGSSEPVPAEPAPHWHTTAVLEEPQRIIKSVGCPLIVTFPTSNVLSVENTYNVRCMLKQYCWDSCDRAGGVEDCWSSESLWGHVTCRTADNHMPGGLGRK